MSEGRHGTPRGQGTRRALAIFGVLPVALRVEQACSRARHLAAVPASPSLMEQAYALATPQHDWPAVGSGAADLGRGRARIEPLGECSGPPSGLTPPRKQTQKLRGEPRSQRKVKMPVAHAGPRLELPSFAVGFLLIDMPCRFDRRRRPLQSGVRNSAGL
jgi:hypothetical protein